MLWNDESIECLDNLIWCFHVFNANFLLLNIPPVLTGISMSCTAWQILRMKESDFKNLMTRDLFNISEAELLGKTMIPPF